MRLERVIAYGYSRFPKSNTGSGRTKEKMGNSVMKGKRKWKPRSARFGGMLLRRIANPVAQVQSGLKGLRANETRTAKSSRRY